MRWAFVIGIWLAVLGSPDPCAGQSNPQIESRDVSLMREEIAKINLLNGLGLTSDQLQRLRRILVEADDVREVMSAEQKRFEARCIPAFEELRKVVWAGRPLPKELYERCKALDDGNRVLANRYLRHLQPLEEKLVRVLTPAQRAAVDEHAECMVPAPGVQDPEKIGQAGNGFAYRALLSDVRKMSPAAFLAKRPGIVKNLADAVENDFGLVGSDERGAFERRCREVLDEVRAMSAVRFALRQGDLARELDPQVQDIRLKNRRVAFDVSLVGGLGKLGRNLLDVRLLPVVEERIAAGPAAPATSPGSLIRTCAPAETCSTRGCSVGKLGQEKVPGAR